MTASTIGFVIYLSITVLLVFVLSIRAYNISKWKDTTSFIKAVISMKSIYGTVLVHLYDTSTDVAILISWSILAYNEVTGKKNYENVNMLSFLVPSIFLIFTYRIAYATIHRNIFRGTSWYSKCDMILILLDLYIFVLVYHQFSLQYLSPCMMQKKLQLLESVFESMPQLVMQSIFLIRTYNTNLVDNDIYIVFASIIASLLSIVSKFLNDDTEWVNDSASQSHLTYKRCPCISISYLAVVIWRFCESIARFSIFTLLWTVVGGLYLPIYLLISVAIYYCLERFTDIVWFVSTKTKHQKTKPRATMTLIFVLQSVVGVPLKRHLIMNIIRFIDNCAMLSVICIFAFRKFDCILCYNKDERDAMYNPYILILLLISSAGTIMEFIIYLGLYCMNIVVESKKMKNVQIIGSGDLNNNTLEAISIHPQLGKMLKNVQMSTNENKTTNAAV